MPFLIGALVIFVLVIAPLYERYKLHRANAKFQRSIWVYDEARRRRILAGEDPRSIPTAEDNLRAMGFGAQVKNIRRAPRPDPVMSPPEPAAHSAPSLLSPPTPISRTSFVTPPIVEQAPMARIAPSDPIPLPQPYELPAAVPPILGEPIILPVPALPSHQVPTLQPLSEGVFDEEWVPVRAQPSLDRFETFSPLEPSLRYHITYMTEWGEVTERRIRVKRVYSEHGEIYVEAHCYLRRAQRTFRADRISEMTHLDDDLPISDPAEHFSSFMDPEEIISSEHELVMGKARPGLYALVWVGRAGGDIEDQTLSILIDFISARARMGRGSKEFNRRIAERWIADQRPTFEIASGSLSRMKRGGPEWQMTYETGRNVVTCNDPEKRQKRLAKLFKP